MILVILRPYFFRLSARYLCVDLLPGVPNEESYRIFTEERIAFYLLILVDYF